MSIHVAGQVQFRDRLACASSEAPQLMDLCWSNALLDAGRSLLAEVFPRRRFETKFGVTVGTARAGKGGTYFVGKRDVHEGIERRDRMVAKGTLVHYAVGYSDGAVGLSVGLTFTLKNLHPWLHCYAGLYDERCLSHAAALTEAVFEVVGDALRITGASDADVYAGWVSQERLMGLYLSDAQVALLGGASHVRAHAPAREIRRVGGASSGLMVQFVDSPQHITPEQQQAALDFIAPITPARPHVRWPVWRRISESEESIFAAIPASRGRPPS